MVKLFITGCFLCAVLSFGYGILVIYKNVRKKVNLLCGCMALSIGIWSLGLGLMVSAGTFTAATFYLRYVHYFGAILIAPFLFHFAVVLLGKEKRYRIFILSNYIVAVILEIANFKGILATVAVKPPFNYYTDSNHISYYLFAVIFTLDVVFAHYLLFKESRVSSGVRKEQMIYLVTGSAISFMGGSTAFPMVFNINIFPIGVPLAFVYVIAATYAIVKYHLMDIRIVINRAVLFVFVYIPFLAVPFFITFRFENMLKKFTGPDFWMFPTILEGVLAITGLFLYRRIRKKTEVRLLQAEYKCAEEIEALSDKFIDMETVGKLGDFLVKKMLEISDISNIALYVLDDNGKGYELKNAGGKDNEIRKTVIEPDNDLVRLISKERKVLIREEIQFIDGIACETMKEVQGEVVIPCEIKKNLVALIFIGEKTTRRIYSQVEMLAFKSMGDQVALTIQRLGLQNKMIALKETEQQARHLVSLGYMVTNISHELRNPLHVISGYSEVVADAIDMEQNRSDFDERTNKLLSFILAKMEDIMDRSSKTSDILDSILRTIKVTSSSFTELKFKDIVDEAILRISPYLESTNIKVNCNLTADLPLIKGDNIMLEQVFVNLLTNAIQAIELSGKGDRIDITGVLNNDCIIMEVTDNGPGIDASDTNRIFEPFYTTKDNLYVLKKGKSKGVGLGLMIVYQIIKKHGGNIYVREHEGPGTVFVIEIPVKIKEEDI